MSSRLTVISKELSDSEIWNNKPKLLELQKNQKILQNSFKILKTYGNMSSATILFVLKEMLSNPQNKNKEIVKSGVNIFKTVTMLLTLAKSFIP